jgi:hypothetical protein
MGNLFRLMITPADIQRWMFQHWFKGSTVFIEDVNTDDENNIILVLKCDENPMTVGNPSNPTWNDSSSLAPQLGRWSW